jgi:carbon storage regulator
MLVLTRRVGERIMLGDDITVEVMSMTDTKVRLGVVAPRDVDIDREEVREQKDEIARAGVRAGLAR